MPRIFISYRRADTEVITGRIHDRLIRDFGERNIFKDVDDIPPGADFRKVLHDEIVKCDAVLVMIGPRWADIEDHNQTRRLHDPNDFVRIEVESAIREGDILVVPVLVQGAQMPTPADLPESLQNLAYLNAVVVRNDPDFNRDMERLTARLRKVRSRRKAAPPRPLLFIGLALLVAIAALLVWLAGNPSAPSGDETIASNITQTAALPSETPTTPPPSETPPPTTPPPSATPAITPAAAVGPSGRIMYIEQGSIVTITADGMEISRVSIDLPIAGAGWSPDGKRIAYMTWDGSVGVMNSNGTDAVELVKHAAKNYIGRPFWSLDGTKIAYVGDVHDPPETEPNADIYVINADGSGLRRVTDDEGQDWPQYWTADGQIAFIRYDGSQNIYGIDPDGTNRTVLANYGIDGGVMPSPDGRYLVTGLFDTASQTNEIHRLDADGTNPRRLTENTVNEGVMSWSPDSQYLLCVTVEGEKIDYYLMKADGSDVRQITLSGTVAGAVWLP